MMLFSLVVSLCHCSKYLIYHQPPSFKHTYAQWSEGGIVIAKVDPQDRLSLNEKWIPIDKAGNFILGFSRKDTTKQSIVWEKNTGEVSYYHFYLASQTYHVSKLKVSKKFSSFSKKSLERIKKEKIKKTKAVAIQSSKIYYNTLVKRPAKGRVSDVFGSERYYNGVLGRPHYGIDYANVVGSPVIAPWGGVVTLVEKDMYFSGGLIIVDHGHEVFSHFLHLSNFFVAVGDTIIQGQHNW